jgi:hypothetical protein
VTAGGGWIKLHRAVAEHWVWQRRPWGMGQLWAHLLLSANYREATSARGDLKVGRGQVLTSVEKLSLTVGRDRKTIRAWLRAFASDGMLDIETAHGRDGGYTLLTIRNYERYQSTDPPALDDGLPNAIPDGSDDGLPAHWTTHWTTVSPPPRSTKKNKKERNVKKRARARTDLGSSNGHRGFREVEL